MASVGSPAIAPLAAVSSRRLGVLSVAVPTVLAAALCLFELTTRSLGFDEAASVTIAAQHGGALWHAIAHDGGNMAGYYVLLHVLIAVFGNGLVVLRLPSAVFATATVALTSVLALRLFGRRVALATGLLCAFSLPLVFWAQSARGYAPMVALVVASFLALVILVDRVADGRSSRWVWVAYFASTTLAIYMGFVAVLAIAAQLLILAVDRRATRAVLSALIASALCCIPLVVVSISRGTGQLFWVPRPALGTAKQLAELLTSSGLEPSFARTSTTWALLGLTTLLLALIASTIIRTLMRERVPSLAWSQGLILAWLVIPIVLSFAESLVGAPIFLARNLLLAAPAVAVLLGWGLLNRHVPTLLGWTVCATVIALRTLQLAPSYGASPEDWRGATAYVLAAALPGDCVAFYPSDGRMAFQYYIGTRPATLARAPRSVLPGIAWGQVRPYVEDYASLRPAQLNAIQASCRRLWFVFSHTGDPHGPGGARANQARFLALGTALNRRYIDRATATLGYAAPIGVALLVR